MSTTIQNTIDYCLTQIQYSPLSVGTANEPALTIANVIQSTVFNAPFTWGFNRAEDSSLSTVAGTQDYTVNLTDFGYLEKVTLTDPNGVVFEVMDVYNVGALGKADASANKRGRPNSVSVILLTYGTSLKLRFIGVPDKVYNVLLTYQKLVAKLTTLAGATGTWYIPDQFVDVYTSLFLAEAFATVDDARAGQYRQRGVAALLDNSEGLTEMQKNAFLAQYTARNSQQTSVATGRTQQGLQGRQV